MADVRALLKAKREEKRISHPFAAYSQNGQLRCTACSIIVKHASAWNGHLGSKSHRTNGARVKEEERLREALELEKRQGKRKADDEDEDEDFADGLTKKRRIEEDDHGGQQQVTAQPEKAASGFPSDFFSDPSRTIPIAENDSDEEAGDKDNPPVSAIESQSNLDIEWSKFQESVINAPVEADVRETFERATIFAEPQLSTEVPEGFPSSVVTEPTGEPELNTTAEQKDGAQKRREREEEEKELIMDRLLDEERAQEEADERVAALRTRIDLLKQKRVVARAARLKK